MKIIQEQANESRWNTSRPAKEMYRWLYPCFQHLFADGVPNHKQIVYRKARVVWDQEWNMGIDRVSRPYSCRLQIVNKQKSHLHRGVTTFSCKINPWALQDCMFPCAYTTPVVPTKNLIFEWKISSKLQKFQKTIAYSFEFMTISLLTFGDRPSGRKQCARTSDIHDRHGEQKAVVNISSFRLDCEDFNCNPGTWQQWQHPSELRDKRQCSLLGYGDGHAFLCLCFWSRAEEGAEKFRRNYPTATSDDFNLPVGFSRICRSIDQ